MATTDRTHWDEKYGQPERAAASDTTPSLPHHFEPFSDHLAGAADVLEIACGEGRTAVWLAVQGCQVDAYDISPVAIARAKELASTHAAVAQCRFATADFDDGLPPGDPVDLVVCNMFRDAALDEAIIGRLRPKGLLAIAALSEVGASPGRFRVGPGELTAAFASLQPLASGEADGLAWLVARKP